MKLVARIVPILASAVAVTSAGAMFVAGCSGDNSPSPSDGGAPDATIDGQGEDVVNQDTGMRLDADAGLATPDAEAGVTSDAEAGASDAEASIASDAEASIASDAEAGIGDSSLPITVTAATFAADLATAFCDTIAACCGTSGDAATFNWAACYSAKLAAGYSASNTGANLLDGGHVAFNASQAQTCLNTIAAADCTANQITAAEQGQLYQSCYAAYAGTLSAGSPCAGTIECAPGNFCSPTDGGIGDAGAIGLCQPLAGDGGACGVFGAGTQGVGQTICSYRGAASDGLFCQNISGDAGSTQTDPATWTCQSQWPVGTDCYVNQDCASFICHQVGTSSVFQCANAGNWANANTCSSYAIAIPDSGGDD
jgi:hypothetical protein